MSSHEADVDQKEGAILHLRDQTIRVALDVEDHAVPSDEVCSAEAGFYLGRARPRGVLDESAKQAQARVGLRERGST